MSSIDVRELKLAIDTLMDELLRVGVNEIELKDRNYWTIFPEEKYKFDKKPTDLGAGDLFDDIESMKDILSSPEEGVHYLLVKLASLLIYVAERADDQIYGQKCNE